MPAFLDNFYALRFVYLLTQAWTDTEAYRLGIIDSEGKALKKRSELQSSEEKDAYTRFHTLVWKLRRLLEKVPLGKQTIARYATALLLLREEFGTQLEESFIKHLKSKNIEIPSISQIVLESESNKYIKVFGILFEKAEDGSLFLPENITTAGFDMVDRPLKKPKSEEEEKKENVESPDDSFAGHIVFSCDNDTFHKCRLGKTPYARYKTYVGDDEIGQKIREYGLKYPNKSIILKNSLTGSMLYLRKKH